LQLNINQNRYKAVEMKLLVKDVVHYPFGHKWVVSFEDTIFYNKARPYIVDFRNVDISFLHESKYCPEILRSGVVSHNALRDASVDIIRMILKDLCIDIAGDPSHIREQLQDIIVKDDVKIFQIVSKAKALSKNGDTDAAWNVIDGVKRDDLAKKIREVIKFVDLSVFLCLCAKGEHEIEIIP
jgi:hypothetical protein